MINNATKNMEVHVSHVLSREKWLKGPEFVFCIEEPHSWALVTHDTVYICTQIMSLLSIGFMFWGEKGVLVTPGSTHFFQGSLLEVIKGPNAVQRIKIGLAASKARDLTPCHLSSPFARCLTNKQKKKPNIFYLFGNHTSRAWELFSAVSVSDSYSTQCSGDHVASGT